MDRGTAQRINAAAAVLMALPPLSPEEQAAWEAEYIEGTKALDP